MVNVTAFLGLNVMRYLKKDPQDTSSHIVTSGLKAVNTLFALELDSLPIPHLNLTQKLEHSFSLKPFVQKQMLGFLVHMYLKLYMNPNIRGFLAAGCLLALGDNGLGAISWAQRAMKALGLKDDEGHRLFFECMCNELMAGSSLKVWQFLCRPDLPETYGFARLFNQNALIDFSTQRKKEFVLACVFIALGEQAEETLEKFAQFKDMQAGKDQIHDFAKNVVAYITTSRVSRSTTAASQRVQEFAERKKSH
jgi:hypothetical protein